MRLIRKLRSMILTPRVCRTDRRRFRPCVEALEDRFAPAQLTVTSPSDPATLTSGTLRWAVAQANADAAKGISDTISFSSALNGTTITLYEGQLVLSGAGAGTITINGADEVAISANTNPYLGPLSRIFQVNTGVHATLIGLTIENGNVGPANGGGILNYGTLTLSGDEFINNKAAYGGGVFNDGANLTVGTYGSFASLLNGNSASYGGAIYTESNASISSTSFAGNHASVDGGAIGNVSTLTMSNSTLSTNWATTWGGGIFNGAGSATLTNCTISSATMTNAQYGGAIFNESPLAMQLNNCTIAGNSANYGGGIFNEGTLYLNGGSLKGNGATVDGGAVGNTASLTLYNDCSIFGNNAAYGGGIFTESGSATNVIASVIQDNRASADGGGIFNEGWLSVNSSSWVGGSLINGLWRYDNWAASEGAGIFNEGTVIVDHSWVTYNLCGDDGGGIVNASNHYVYVQNGSVIDYNYAYGGAGIDNMGSVYVTNGSWIENNVASWRGGGINNGGIVTVSNSTLDGNSAGSNGGGIANYGTVTLETAVVEYNTVSNGDGGGLFNYNGGVATVEYASQFVGNTAETGAGIDNLASLSVYNSTFNANHASWNGGGIANWANAFVTGSTFEYDHAGNDGGGIYNADSLTIGVIVSTFEYENAVNVGGGICNLGGSVSYTQAPNGHPYSINFYGNSAALAPNFYLEFWFFF